MKILMVSPTPPYPTSGGNRARVLEMLTSLDALGHEVHLLHVEREAGDGAAMRGAFGDRYHSHPYNMPRAGRRRTRIMRWLRRLGLNAGYQWGLDDWWPDDADACVSRLHAEHGFDAVLVEYIFYSRAFAVFPRNVLKVLDTHDVFGDRYKLYLDAGMQPQWYSTSRRNEARAVARADVVVAIQEHEAEYYKAIGGRRVTVVGHAVDLASQPLPTAGQQLLYLGADNPINAQSMRWFLETVWPQVQAHCPDARLQIAGTICQSLSERAGVRLLGRVDDLAATYEAANIVINPMLFGTGLKIKTIEAMGMGRPVVTTGIGAAGLESAAAGGGCVIADDPPEYAQALIGLLTDPSAQLRAGSAAWTFARAWNDEVSNRLASIWRAEGAPS